MDENRYNNNPSQRRRSSHDNGVGEPYRAGARQGSDHRRRKRGIPVALAIGIDVIVAALILLVFYLDTYVLQPKVSGIDLIPSATSSAASPGLGATNASGSAKPATTPDQSSWRTKFADKFTGGEVVQTATSYKSANVNINIIKEEDNGVVYFVTDIYVADLKYFKTAFAKSPGDVEGYHESVPTIAQEQGALVAINGDYCLDNKGFVVRNSKLFDRTKSPSDALVMYQDGSMQTIPASELDMDKIIAKAPYQVWTFGPMLLNNGEAMTQFNSPQNVGGANNPRTAIGYFEPGHYCFVTVDGRQEGYSYPGYSLQQLSQLFKKLGCKVAFNLDGGQSTELVYYFNNSYSFVNKPYNGGRSTSDIVYITDK